MKSYELKTVLTLMTGTVVDNSQEFTNAMKYILSKVNLNHEYFTKKVGLNYEYKLAGKYLRMLYPELRVISFDYQFSSWDEVEHYLRPYIEQFGNDFPVEPMSYEELDIVLQSILKSNKKGNGFK